MQILEFKESEYCYMLKKNDVKIDRSELWGDPEQNKGSILAHCQEFLEKDDDQNIAHVVYYYGQGGIGKSFVFDEIAKKLKDKPYKERLYTAVVDLQVHNSFEDDLKCLADEIEKQMGNKELFPKFSMAYYSYKMKKGEEVKKDERGTKWDNLNDNSTFSLVSNVAGMLTPFGTVSSVVDLANEGYKLLASYMNDIKYRKTALQIKTMESRELQNQLVSFFTADFMEILKVSRKKNRKFVFMLDTLESMRYKAIRRGEGEDYLEWLIGPEGLFRMLPDCLWLIFGREKISWVKYDQDWKVSFVSEEMEKPGKKVIREYLQEQLGQKELEKGSETEAVLKDIIEKIIDQTEGYTFGIANFVDVYFRIWNSELRKESIKNQEQADNYRPQLKDLDEVLAEGGTDRRISARFLQYYTHQEREVLYTLVCLEKWTDEILEQIIWKGMPSNILLYEEICNTSFIRTDEVGIRTIDGLMLNSIMKECSQNFKSKLLLMILSEIRERGIDESYRLLLKSAIHILGFCEYNKRIRVLLGEQLVRTVENLLKRADFSELSEICDKLMGTAAETDEDLYNAAAVASYFCRVFRNENSATILETLKQRAQFGDISRQIWKLTYAMAWYAGNYAEAYEIADILAPEECGQAEDAESYEILMQRAELMQRLGNRFESAQIEEELTCVCELAKKLMQDESMTAEKLNMRLWAEYYFYYKRNLDSENAFQKIGDCIAGYRESCTEAEAEESAELCVLEIMLEWTRRPVVRVDAINEWALKGLRILEKLYGDQAVEQQDAEFLFQAVFTGIPMIEQEWDVYRDFFEIYYKKFYKDGNWQIFSSLALACSERCLGEAEGNGRVKAPLHDIIEQGLLYIRNYNPGSLQTQLKIALSLYLSSELNSDIETCLHDSGWEIRNYTNNNMLLLLFLKKVLENKSEEDCLSKETVLLRAAFEDKPFADKCFTVEEKRSFLSILKMCGLDTARESWKASYTGSAEGQEFRILEALRGWMWGLDQQMDVKGACILLYAARQMKDPVLEKKMREQLIKKFHLYNDGAVFWNLLMKEADSHGGDCKKYIESLFCEMISEEKFRPDSVSVKGKELLLSFKEGLPQQHEKETAVFEGRWDTSEEEIYEMKLRGCLERSDYDSAREMIREVFNDFNSKERKLIGNLAPAFLYKAVVKNRGMDGFLESIQQQADQIAFLGRYFILRAYVYLDDKEGFAAYYRENRQLIWEQLTGNRGFALSFYSSNELYHMASYIFKLEEADIAEDFCAQMADWYESSKDYTRGILRQLKWLTQHVPFQIVWRPKAFIREIKDSNYDEMYRLAEEYLSSAELLDCFVNWMRGKWEGLMKGPAISKLNFLSSEYYAWMSEKFGEAFHRQMAEELQELLLVQRDYEANYSNDYQKRIHKLVYEIKELS